MRDGVDGAVGADDEVERNPARSKTKLQWDRTADSRRSAEAATEPRPAYGDEQLRRLFWRGNAEQQHVVAGDLDGHFVGEFHFFPTP